MRSPAASLAALLKKTCAELYAAADRLNVHHMRQLSAAATPAPEVLDLGCGDGWVTRSITAGLRGARVRAIESHEPFRRAALERDIDAIASDLERRLPIDDDSVDLVISNQVIEHLADTDHFVSEIHRVLRPGGLAVVSTENMASWHNVFALVLGFQPFSSTNYSRRRYPLGNPAGLHTNENMALPDGMLHRRIFTTRALKELLEAHGFSVVDVRGSGYHPLPARIGDMDTAHAHFISVAARKVA